MSDTESFGRISVPAQTFSRLSEEVQKIRAKGSHYKLNEGRLAAAIIDKFFERYIEKDRDRLLEKFLDKKSYLKSLITNSASEEELAAFMKTSQRKAKRVKSDRSPDE